MSVIDRAAVYAQQCKMQKRQAGKVYRINDPCIEEALDRMKREGREIPRPEQVADRLNRSKQPSKRKSNAKSRI